MSAIKRFAGQTAIYGVSTIFSRLLNFILTPLYTSVFSPAVYGIFTKMYSWASILNAVLAFGMETTFFRYLNKHEKEKDRVYGNTFLIILLTALVFFLFTFFFVDGIASWMNKDSTQAGDYALYIKYFIYILIADALAVIPFAKVRADGRPIRFGVIKLLNILSFMGLNILFLVLIPIILKNNWYGSDFIESWYKPEWLGYVFIANLIASVITLFLLLPEFLQLKLRFDVVLAKDMLLYSFPILIANISFIINENVDKIFMGHLLPETSAERDVGIYAACAKIAIFLNIFVQAFRLGAEPFFFSHANSKNAGVTYARIMNYFVIVVCVIFVALVANIEILKYFIGTKGTEAEQELYWSGLKVVPILLFGYVSLGIYMNLSIWYKLSDQTRFGLYISGIGALLTIILNFIFIPKHSYMAAAWVSLTAYATMMILSYVLGQKNYPIPYNLRKNLSYLVSSIVLVVLMFFVFNRDLIIGNLILILYLLAIFFAEKRELKLLFKAK